jgi:PAS domain S-box-containing protein
VKPPGADLQKKSDALLAEISERRRAEEALRVSEQRLQDILDNTTAVVFVKDLDLRYLLINREYERRHQVQRDQIRGKTDFDIFPEDVAENVRTNDRHVIEAGTPIQFEETVPVAEGDRQYIVVKFLLRDRTTKPYAICGIATDITELKRAEELQARRACQAALRADIHAAFCVGTETALPTMLQRGAEAIVRHLDAAFARIWTLNDRQKLLELQASAGLYTRLDDEHARVPVGQFQVGLIAEERKPHLTNDLLNDIRVGHPDWARQERLVSFAGYPLLVEGRLVGVVAMFGREPLPPDTQEALEAVSDTLAQGIERKRAEEKLGRLNRTLRTAYECNQALVRATEENELLRSICRILIKIGGLRMAWVGYRESNREKTVRPVACAGYEEGYLESVNITWADTERGRGPVGTAIRTSTTSWNNDILTDPNMAPWRADAMKRGYASAIALPLMSRGEAFGALALYAEDCDAFSGGTIEQYTDLANNLAYGVMALRTQEQRKKAENEVLQLNASLEKRVVERTIELVRSNDQLKKAQAQLRKGREQVQKHRDVLLGLARSDKSDLAEALETICSHSATTLEVARVSYWSLQDNGSAIVGEVLYLRDTHSCAEQFQGTRLGFSDCPAYFQALASKQPIVADQACWHPATSELAENYLQPLGISSMLDAPVWVGGEVVGVLCHEHVGRTREWSAEEIDFVSALASMVSLALEESSRTRSEHLLRDSEEKFRALFEGTSQAVVLHDENGIFEANASWLQLLGYSSLEEVIGKHPSDVSVPIQPGGERAEVLAAKHITDARTKGSARFEWMVLRRDGVEIPIEVFLSPIELCGRQMIQAVCVDITQRKQVETEMLRTLAREKQLGQLRSSFVSMVSHEFRTPLGIIQSSAEILEDYLDKLEPAERQDHLHSIRKNTRRMAELMEEALLIGSFDAGKMEFKAVPMDLGTFIERLVAEVLSATNRRCPIELSLAEIPDEFKGDERLLRHIFTNLLTNAVKYSDAGQVVRFDLGRDKKEIVCAIRDQGIGIPETDREWLFNAFHRGHNVSDRPGTGLGLVIVKRCVDLHGGSIKVESKLGEGTTMTVRLPIARPASVAAR